MDSRSLLSDTAAAPSNSELRPALLPHIAEEEEEKDRATEEEGEEEAALLISDAEAAQLRQEEEARIVQAINLSVQSAAHLTNLLPTGTLLFFQFLLPILSNGGDCSSSAAVNGSPDNIYTAMTTALLIACGAWCSFLPFTDTIKAPNGKFYHGVATPRGLWLPPSAPPSLAAAHLSRFRLRPLDFLHAFLSLSVFAAVALFTPNVTACLLSDSTLLPPQLQNSLPLVVGFVASFICILFPSPRRSFDQSLLERLVDEPE